MNRKLFTSKLPIEAQVVVLCFVAAGVWFGVVSLAAFSTGLAAGLVLVGAFYLVARRNWRWHDWVNNVALVALVATVVAWDLWR